MKLGDCFIFSLYCLTCSHWNCEARCVTSTTSCNCNNNKFTEAVNFGFLHMLQFCVENPKISDVKQYKLNIKRSPSFIWSFDIVKSWTFCCLGVILV